MAATFTISVPPGPSVFNSLCEAQTIVTQTDRNLYTAAVAYGEDPTSANSSAFFSTLLLKLADIEGLANYAIANSDPCKCQRPRDDCDSGSTVIVVGDE